MSKTAIVILNWNGVKMLSTYLPGVIRHAGADTEVVVADNASTDNSLEYLRQNHPEVTIIPLEKNWGFAEGYNRALRQVKAEYYVLLNSDVDVTPGWLLPLVQFMDEHPQAAACQPKLRAVADRGAFEYAGAAGGFIDALGYPFCRGRVFDTVEQDEGQYDTIQEVFWTTGACMMVRADDYWAVGGLDARFFAHNEEIDLCWRMRNLGRQLFCIPQSVVYHVGGGTLPKGNPMKTFLNFRNNLTMLYKNLPESELHSVMRKRWALDYIAAWQTLLCNRNWGDFKAIYRARKAFRKWRHDFDDDRREIQKTCAVKSIPQRKPFSILWQYYFHRRRRFMQMPISSSPSSHC